MFLKRFLVGAALWAGSLAGPAVAQLPYEQQLREGQVILRGFRFASGDRMDGVRIHYATLGTPRRDRAGRIAMQFWSFTGPAAPGGNSCSRSSQTSCSDRASRWTSSATM
jgi:homoserine O-acetyltransferase